MDGCGRVLASAIPMRLHGRFFLVRPLTLGALGMAEQIILAERRWPTDAVRESLGKGKASHALATEMTYRALEEIWRDKSLRVVTCEDLHAWLRTEAGLAFGAWQCLEERGRPAFPDPTAAAKFLAKCSTAELRAYLRAQEMASGTDDLSRMDWPDPVGDGSSGPKWIQWKKLFRYFARECGWTPEEVGKLTMWQVKLFSVEDKDLGGVVRVGAADGIPRRRKSPFDRLRRGPANKDHAARRRVREMIARGETLGMRAARAKTKPKGD